MSTFIAVSLIVFGIAGLSITLHNLYISGTFTYKEFIIYLGIILIFFIVIFYFKIEVIKSKEKDSNINDCGNYYWKNNNAYKNTKTINRY